MQVRDVRSLLALPDSSPPGPSWVECEWVAPLRRSALPVRSPSLTRPCWHSATRSCRRSSAQQQWIDGYQPGAEANHGYGTGKIERLTADPRPQWRTQLTAFDADARRNGAQSFAALPRDGRQALVRTALAAERGDSLPAPLAASHIALALLGYFYDSPAATDLCYEVQIGRQRCRPLPAQRQQPVALTRRDR